MARPPLPDGPWLVVGLARSGLAAGRLLAGRGEEVVGVDAGAPELPGDLPFRAVTGTDGLAELERARAVVKSPGVPPRAPVVAEARARGVPVLGELELGWRFVHAPVVAVTGTNGKTTVTSWLGHVLRTAGRRVAEAGNVGTPLASLAGTRDTVVLECSSYQLHDCTDFVPDVGLLLNLEPDHLDWHGSFEHYAAAKQRVLRAPVAFGPDAELPDAVPPAELGLPGAHNRRNAQFVAAAARALHVPDEAIAEGLRTFRGVEHRLEDLGEVDGVRYVNDSKATNVGATLTALRAQADLGRVHLVLGGHDGKGEDFGPLAPLAGRTASIHLIGEAAGRLHEAVGGHLDGDLATAVEHAARLAAPGDVVLLSPACASFDQFRDFEQRGRAFKEIVRGRRTRP